MAFCFVEDGWFGTGAARGSMVLVVVGVVVSFELWGSVCVCVIWQVWAGK
jgi:hypothetical protein